MIDQNRLPVHLITGFLGSGRTTFLNHFVSQRKGERILVVENECGETNVDGALVLEGADDVVELTSGCLCCSLANGLIDILESIAAQRAQYDRIVIETTGIADPSSIMETFLSDPRVEKVFALEQITCLVDAGLVDFWLKETEEALRQIAISDVILVNKIDTIAAAKLTEVLGVLERINPQAYVMHGQNGVFDVNAILKVGSTRSESVELKLDDNTRHHHDSQGGACDHHVHDHHNDHVHNSHGITTFTLSFDGVFNLDALSLELYRIVNLYRDQVYRVKGIIALPEYGNRVILQSVRSSFVATDGRPWEEGDHRTSKLVFIGRNLKKKVFQKMFERYLEKELSTT